MCHGTILMVNITESGLASFLVEIDKEATKVHELISNYLTALYHIFQYLQFKHVPYSHVELA